MLRCNSDRTLSASELLDHPFLRSSLLTNDDKDQRIAEMVKSPPLNTIRVQKNSAITSGIHNQTLPSIPSLPSSQSRLGTEFEVLAYLGKGAFGDVLKVTFIYIL